MPYQSSRDYLDVANEQAAPLLPASTFDENFAASVGEIFDEFMSFSPNLHKINVLERDRLVDNLINNGDIPDDQLRQFKVMGGYTKYDYDGLARWANENLQLEDALDTNNDLYEARNEDMALRRQYRADIFSRATGPQKAFNFATQFVMSGLDPVNVAAAALTPISVGSKAASRALFTASVAGRSAVAGVASQAALEPFIYSWQQETNGEYTWKNSLFNLAAAGVFSGAIGGTAAYFGHGFSTKLNEGIGDIDENLRFMAVKDMEQVARARHKELVDQFDEQINKLDPEDPSFEYHVEQLQSKILLEDERLDRILTQMRKTPSDYDSVHHMFRELGILKRINDPERDLAFRYRELEETVERLESPAPVRDEPPIENTLRQPKSTPRRNKEQRQEKALERKKKAADGVKPTLRDRAEIESDLNASREELRRMVDEVDEARERYIAEQEEQYYPEQIQKLLTTRERLQHKIDAEDGDTLRSQKKIEDWNKRIAKIDERIDELKEDAVLLPDEVEETLAQKFGQIYNKEIKAKEAEVRALKQELEGLGIKDPIEEALDEFPESATFVDEDGNTIHMRDVIDRAETAEDEFNEVLTCVMGHYVA